MDVERTIVFVFHLFLKVEPSGRLIFIKRFITTSGTDFLSSTIVL